MDINEKYTVRYTPIATGANTWNVLNVEILLKHEDGKYEKIGEYKRNYSSFYNTFVPFKHANGKEYALYSKDYSTVSVMSLPNCKHVADSHGGFCPVDLYVPDFSHSEWELEYYGKELASLVKDGKKSYEKEKLSSAALAKEIEFHNKQIEIAKDEIAKIGTMGLVAGCVWGDDSGGWKVMYLDMSQLEKGKIELTGALGYFQLPNVKHKLKDLVEWESPDRLCIPLDMQFQFHEDPDKSGFLGYSMSDIPFYKGDFYDLFEIVRTKKGEVHGAAAGDDVPTDEQINKILTEVNDGMDNESDDAMNDYLREIYRIAWKRGRLGKK